MKIKQLTYTSLEHGWTIERIVGLPEEREISEFKKISGSRPADEVLYSYDYNNGVGVLSRSVPYGTDTEKRPRYYLHGYVFSSSECDEIFKEPAVLLGLENFVGSIEEPLCEDVALKAYKNKCADNLVATLVEGIYEALLKNEIMEISFPGADGELLIKTVMNTVLCYVPLTLRKLISFGSTSGTTIRDIAATENFSNYAKIRYNLKTMEAEGIDGSYRELVEILLSENGDECLALIEEKIGNPGTNKTACMNALKNVIDDVLFEISAQKRILADQIPQRLSEVLDRKCYDKPVDIKVMCNIFAGISRNKLVLSEGFDEKIVDVYLGCGNTELHSAIKNYFADRLLNSKDKIDSEFKKLFLGVFPQSLKAGITEKMIDTKDKNIILCVVLTALKNDDCAKILLENCNQRYIDIISDYAADAFENSGAETDLFSLLIKSPLYTCVMPRIINAAKGNLWNYFKVAFASFENYTKHKTLGNKESDFLKKVFERDVTKYREDALQILRNAHLDEKKEFYDSIEREFVNLGAQSVVEEFYIDFISQSAKTTRELEAQKIRLASLGIPTHNYVTQSAQRYARLCFGEAATKDGVGIREISKLSLFTENDFVENLGAIKGIDIKELKTDFWKKFKFKSYKFSKEVQVMKLDSNPKSELANALFELSEFLRGNIPEPAPDIFELCKRELCSDGQLLSARVRTALIRELKKSAENLRNIKPELHLMLNYSVSKKTADIKTLGLDAKELYSYVANSISDKSSMLYVGKNYKTVYDFASKMRGSKTRTQLKEKKGTDDSNMYSKIVELMEKQDDFDLAKKKSRMDIITTLKNNKGTIIFYLALVCMALAGNLFVIYTKKLSVAIIAGMITILVTSVSNTAFSVVTKERNRLVSSVIVANLIIVVTTVLIATNILTM